MPETHYRIGDMYPKILNCKKGIEGEPLLGFLETYEIDEIRGLFVEEVFSSNPTLLKEMLCGVVDKKVTIAYRSEEIDSFPSSSIICAYCMQECTS